MLALHHNESVALCSSQGVLYYVVCVYTRLQQCRDQVSFSKAQTSGFEIALLHENFPLCVCVCSSCAFCLLLFFTHANMQKNTQKIPTKTNQIILIGICLRAAATLYLLALY